VITDAKKILGCVWVIVNNRFPSTGQPWAVTEIPLLGFMDLWRRRNPRSGFLVLAVGIMSFQ